MSDIDLEGHILKRFEDDSVLFEEAETGKKARLPREQIAIIQGVSNVIVSLPFGLARAKGLA